MGLTAKNFFRELDLKHKDMIAIWRTIIYGYALHLSECESCQLSFYEKDYKTAEQVWIALLKYPEHFKCLKE